MDQVDEAQPSIMKISRGLFGYESDSVLILAWALIDEPLVTRIFFIPVLTCYTRAFGDGPRNFEPWSSDEDDT
ncbi:hypothetical protein TNCV_3964471 [Trichonephila clavipes]|nr:hypothetical protein TNCV_3964471 [Trichonephila clavipes]